MKKCFVYGNCQARIIKYFLERNENFTSIYQIIDLKIVHLLSQKDIVELEYLVANADLFIHQNISDNYKGIPQLGTNYLRGKTKATCQSISVPVSYFTGYNPELIYFRDRQNNNLEWDFSIYHDFHILNLFYQQKSPWQIVDIIQRPDFYNPQYGIKNLNHSLKLLINREGSLDIKISEFIKQRHQEYRLFHTFNHPSSAIIYYVVGKVLQKINLLDHFSDELIFNQPEFLNNSCFPIYPSIQKQLQLEFDCDLRYILNFKSFSISEVVTKFCEFYSNNHDLVEFNVNLYQNKFSGITNYQVPINSKVSQLS